MEEVREIKGCGLIVHGCKAGKERSIALICEEMRIKKKQKTHNATAGTPNSIFPAAF